MLNQSAIDAQKEQERRTHPRTLLNIKVNIKHEVIPDSTYTVRDISDVGVFVVVNDKPFPPLGSVVNVKAMGLAIPAQEQEMVVVRKGLDGFGLQFTKVFDPD